MSEQVEDRDDSEPLIPPTGGQIQLQGALRLLQVLLFFLVFVFSILFGVNWGEEGEDAATLRMVMGAAIVVLCVSIVLAEFLARKVGAAMRLRAEQYAHDLAHHVERTTWKDARKLMPIPAVVVMVLFGASGFIVEVPIGLFTLAFSGTIMLIAVGIDGRNVSQIDLQSDGIHVRNKIGRTRLVAKQSIQSVIFTSYLQNVRVRVSTGASWRIDKDVEQLKIVDANQKVLLQLENVFEWQNVEIGRRIARYYDVAFVEEGPGVMPPSAS